MKENVVTLKVELDTRSYPIHIGSGLLADAIAHIPADLSGRKVFVLYDRNVEGHAQRLMQSFPGAFSLALDGGEKTKSYQHLQDVVGWMLQNHVDRKSVLFVVGGGVIGDLGGFAASIVLRGIDFVQVPTTLLAQVDSSVGGKTGINAPQGKNLVGSFYQPLAVLCDTDTLQTLPPRELKAGYAEIVKYGLLGNSSFFQWLEDHGKEVLALEQASLTKVIEASCAAKAEIVGKDEREQAGGRRALLNLGHTFGHALEAAAGYDGRLLHGEAVSIGMVLAFNLCAKMGLCALQDAERATAHLKACGLKTKITDIVPHLTQTPAQIADLMFHDKKASGGKIGFILVKSIGDAFQSTDVDMADVVAVMAESAA